MRGDGGCGGGGGGSGGSGGGGRNGGGGGGGGGVPAAGAAAAAVVRLVLALALGLGLRGVGGPVVAGALVEVGLAAEGEVFLQRRGRLLGLQRQRKGRVVLVERRGRAAAEATTNAGDSGIGTGRDSRAGVDGRDAGGGGRGLEIAGRGLEAEGTCGGGIRASSAELWLQVG